MEYQIVVNERAMIVGEYIVIADLHFGYEKIIEERGINIPSPKKEFLERLMKIKEESGRKKIILLGDIKHNFPGISANEMYDVPSFFYELSKMFDEVIVIKGNHDGWIERMVHPDNVRVVGEHRLEEYGFIHGNRWPSKEIMERCRVIVMGHSHPSVIIKDIYGRKVKKAAWRVFNLKKSIKEKFKEHGVEKVIIMPTFNTFLYGGEKINGVFSKHLRDGEIFLLDLTKVK